MLSKLWLLFYITRFFSIGYKGEVFSNFQQICTNYQEFPFFPHLIHPWKQAVIHLQFWAYGSWDRCFPYQWVPTASLWVQNTIFNDKSAIPLQSGIRYNKNFASQRQNYAQKMQDGQVTKSLNRACRKKDYCTWSWQFDFSRVKL